MPVCFYKTGLGGGWAQAPGRETHSAVILPGNSDHHADKTDAVIRVGVIHFNRIILRVRVQLPACRR